MVDFGLAGKVVVVTGANNPCGIGAAVAKLFAAQGARVFLHYFRLGSGEEGEGALPSANGAPGEAMFRSLQRRQPDEVLAAVRELGGKARAWEGELSDPDNVPRLFDEAEKSLGPVEVLVNNAAHWQADTFLPRGEPLVNRWVGLWTAPPDGITPRSFNRLFSVNARAAALLMAEFVRRHVERAARWGRIINVSTDGSTCFPSEISYGASKLALEGYTRSAALELGQFGITVNAVALGPVQTGWITPELAAQILPTIPLGRIGYPEDVAPVILFLASEQAGWLTGQRIGVGGGHSV